MIEIVAVVVIPMSPYFFTFVGGLIGWCTGE